MGFLQVELAIKGDQLMNAKNEVDDLTLQVRLQHDHQARLPGHMIASLCIPLYVIRDQVELLYSTDAYTA